MTEPPMTLPYLIRPAAVGDAEAYARPAAVGDAEAHARPAGWCVDAVRVSAAPSVAASRS